MAIHIGQSAKDQAAISIGAQGIQKVYVGDKLVWPDSLVFLHGWLYNDDACHDARGFCPSGWDLMTVAEANSLITSLGGNSVAGGKLKLVSEVFWNLPNIGADNSSLFNGIGSGKRSGVTPTPATYADFLEGMYLRLKNSGGVYSILSVSRNSESVSISSDSGVGQRNTGTSVRLKKTSTSLTHGQTGTVTDYDGNVYPTICINGQEVMAQNYKVTRFNNGDLIPHIESAETWGLVFPGSGRCAPNGNILNV